MNNKDNYQCDATKSQLIVVDVQLRLGAAMPAKVLKRVVQNSALLAFAAGRVQVPVLQTEQYPEGLGETDPEIAKMLPRSTRKFTKTSFSCCGAPGFRDAVSSTGRSQAIVVGMEAHVCVLQTAFDLRAAGFHVYVVEDAVCSRRLENYQNALDRLRQCAIGVVSAESVIFEWLGDAKHESFKLIQSILR